MSKKTKKQIKGPMGKPRSGHVDAILPDDVRQGMDEAWDRWVEAKKRKGRIWSINEVLDAYVAYGKLMRKHVDASWS